MPRGSIRKRRSTWTAVVDVGRDPETRKRRQTSRGGFRTRAEAARWLTKMLSQLDQGSYVAPVRQTVGEHLLDWLPAVRSSLRPSTFESYERNVRQHLLPAIGHVWLDQLTPDRLAAVYAEFHRSGRLDGTGGLAPRSIRYLNTILGKALGDAVAEGKIGRNVAHAPTVRQRLPRHARPEMATWTAEELAAFLTQLRGDRLYTPVLLAATTGMRRGEVLGLRWRDVDLDASRVAVRQTLAAVRDVDGDIGRHVLVFGEPKTAKGRRAVPLPPQAVAALREYRRGQIAERLLIGPDHIDRDLVFAEPDGSPMHPDKFRKRFEVRIARSRLPRIRFHDLRHTYATLALRAGVHPKIVAEVLGHANISITLDTYSHAIPAMQESAAATVARLVFGSDARL
jgi:integrase